MRKYPKNPRLTNLIVDYFNQATQVILLRTNSNWFSSG